MRRTNRSNRSKKQRLPELQNGIRVVCCITALAFQFTFYLNGERMDKMVFGEQVKEVVDHDTKLKDAVRRFERMVILEELNRNNDDKEKVAHLLGISLSSLYRKLVEEQASEIDLTLNSERVN